jgi:hypothetical protein
LPANENLKGATSRKIARDVAWVEFRNRRFRLALAVIRANGTTWTGYAEINKAIMRRWSMAGLRYIKEKAWRLATA